MKKLVIAIPSIVITSLVYALAVTTFFEMKNNALGEGEENFVDIANYDKTYTQQQQQEVETECKSPCPSSAETCIQMCA